MSEEGREPIIREQYASFVGTSYTGSEPNAVDTVNDVKRYEGPDRTFFLI